MTAFNLRQFAPSVEGDWATVHKALREVDAGHITVWAEGHGQTLGSIVLESGSTMATVRVVEAGISQASSGKLWKPVLPLIDVTPLDNRGEL